MLKKSGYIKRGGFVVKSVKFISAECLSNKKLFEISKWCVFLFLLLSISDTFAVDLLANTDTNLKDTLKGTGKNYIYAAEGVSALYVLIKTRNVMACSGIVVVCLFFNILLSIIGY